MKITIPILLAWLLSLPILAEMNPIPMDAVLGAPRFAWSDRPVTSPDGKWVAYALYRRPEKPIANLRYLPNGLPGDKVGLPLWVSEVHGKRTFLACPPKVSCFRPAWSPDGNRIAFYSDAGGALGLWVLEVATRKRTRVFSGPLKISLWWGDEPKWSPDGRTIYFSLRPKAAQKQLARQLKKDPEVRVYRAGSGYSEDPSKSQIKATRNFMRKENEAILVSVDLGTRQVRSLTSEDMQPAPAVFRISPSGSWLSYLSVSQPMSESNQNSTFDLVVLSRDGKTKKVLAEKILSPVKDYHSLTYRWHPTEDRLIFVHEGKVWLSDFRKGLPSSNERLRNFDNAIADPLFFDAAGGAFIIGLYTKETADYPVPEPTRLAWVPLSADLPVKTFDLKPNEEFRTIPIFNDRVAWGSVQYEFAAQVVDGKTGQTSLIGFQPETQGRALLWRGNANLGTFAYFPAGTGEALAVFEDPNTPPDLYLFRKDFKEKSRVTHIEPAFDSMPKVNLKFVDTEVTLYDGTKKDARTALVAPADGKEKRPTLVIGYPGFDDSIFTNSFAGGDPTASLPSAILLNRGYAVAVVSLPIGPEGKPGNPIKETYDVLMPQLKNLADKGLIDWDHMAVMGQSYGGYFAASMITQTNAFKGAISISGIFDLPSYYGVLSPEGAPFGISWSEGGQGRMGNTVWAEFDRYIKNSPYFLADQIKSPLLILHGTEDHNFHDAEKMFAGLRRLGQTVELAAYPNEGHVPREWTLQHATDLAKRIVDFLDRFLK